MNPLIVAQTRAARVIIDNALEMKFEADALSLLITLSTHEASTLFCDRRGLIFFQTLLCGSRHAPHDDAVDAFVLQASNEFSVLKASVRSSSPCLHCLCLRTNSRYSRVSNTIQWIV